MRVILFIHRLLLLSIILVVSACEHLGEEISSPKSENIRFSASIAPLTRANTDLLWNTTWEEGDELGLFAVNAGENLKSIGNCIHNIRLIYQGNEWICDSILLWPEDCTSLDFYAYYPFQSNAQLNPLEFSSAVNLEQGRGSNGIGYNSSDLLLASARVNKGEIVTLTFSHALSLIQLEISPNGNSEETMQQLSVKLQNVCPDYKLNLSDKTVQLYENPRRRDISMLACGKNQTGNWVYRALLPSQILPIASHLFCIEKNGDMIIEVGGLMEYVWTFAGGAECFRFELPKLD